jgi:hypothetical protein
MAAVGMIYIVLPTVGWSWPALLPVAVIAAAKIGYDMVSDPEKARVPTLDRVKRRLRDTQVVSVPLRDLVAENGVELNIEPIVGELASDQMLTFQRGDRTLIFLKDETGTFRVDLLAPASVSRKALRAEAKEFATELVQSFAVNRVVSELEKTSTNVVQEERKQDGDIVLRLRRWS